MSSANLVRSLSRDAERWLSEPSGSASDGERIAYALEDELHGAIDSQRSDGVLDASRKCLQLLARLKPFVGDPASFAELRLRAKLLVTFDSDQLGPEFGVDELEQRLLHFLPSDVDGRVQRVREVGLAAPLDDLRSLRRLKNALRCVIVARPALEPRTRLRPVFVFERELP